MGYGGAQTAVFHSVGPAMIKLRPPQLVLLAREIVTSLLSADLFRRNAGFLDTGTSISDEYDGASPSRALYAESNLHVLWLAATAGRHVLSRQPMQDVTFSDWQPVQNCNVETVTFRHATKYSQQHFKQPAAVVRHQPARLQIMNCSSQAGGRQ